MTRRLVTGKGASVYVVNHPGLYSDRFIGGTTRKGASSVHPYVKYKHYLAKVVFNGPVDYAIGPSMRSSRVGRTSRGGGILIVNTNPTKVRTTCITGGHKRRIVLYRGDKRFKNLLELTTIPVTGRRLYGMVGFVTHHLGGRKVRIHVGYRMAPRVLTKRFGSCRIIYSAKTIPGRVPPFGIFGRAVATSSILTKEGCPKEGVIVLKNKSIKYRATSCLTPLVSSVFPTGHSVAIVRVAPSLVPKRNNTTGDRLAVELGEGNMGVRLGDRIAGISRAAVACRGSKRRCRVASTSALVFTINCTPGGMRGARREIRFVKSYSGIKALGSTVTTKRGLTRRLWLGGDSRWRV